MDSSLCPSRLSPARRPIPARQRGAVAVFAAIALMAMVTAVMLAIEIGRVYTAHRELQKQASLAALDAARVVGGCSNATTDGAPPDASALQALVADSIQRAGGDLTQISGTQIDLGEVSRVVSGEPGERAFAQTDAQDAQAVRVTLSRAFPQPFLPWFPTPANAPMAASATAEHAALGSFQVGSGLLALDTGNSALLNPLLEGLLGGNVNLSLVDYQGLAGVNVSLAALATAVGLDVQDLSDPLALGLQTPVLSDALDGLADALSGSVSGTVVGLLHALEAAAQQGADNPVNMGLLFPQVSDTAADVPFVNLLDLILALGMAANADPDGNVTPIALPIALKLLGVQVSTFLHVLEPPQFSGMARPGVAEVKTAQIALQIRLQVNTVKDILEPVLNLLLLGGLLGHIDTTPIRLGVDLEVARAFGYLDRIHCPRSADPELWAELSARPALAALTLGTFNGNAVDAPPINTGFSQLLGVSIEVLGGLVADIKVNLFLDDAVSSIVGDDTQTPLPERVEQFTRIEDDGKGYWIADGAPPAAPEPDVNPQTVGSSQLLGSAFATLFSDLATNVHASDPDHPDESSVICVLLLVCIPVGDILDAVLAPVLTLLGNLLTGVGGIVDAILDPLLEALGIQLGTATVTMNTVSIDQPRLVSTAVPPLPAN